MAATATILEMLDSGDHVISMDDVYGGTYRLFENVRKRSAGIEFSFANLSDPESLKANLKENTKMIWVESPSNPLLKIVDLRAVSDIRKGPWFNRFVITPFVRHTFKSRSSWVLT